VAVPRGLAAGEASNRQTRYSSVGLGRKINKFPETRCQSRVVCLVPICVRTEKPDPAGFRDTTPTHSIPFFGRRPHCHQPSASLLVRLSRSVVESSAKSFVQVLTFAGLSRSPHPTTAASAPAPMSAFPACNGCSRRAGVAGTGWADVVGVWLQGWMGPVCDSVNCWPSRARGECGRDGQTSVMWRGGAA